MIPPQQEIIHSYEKPTPRQTGKAMTPQQKIASLERQISALEDVGVYMWHYDQTMQSFRKVLARFLTPVVRKECAKIKKQLKKQLAKEKKP